MSHISILDTDILWSIFSYNAILNSRPVITARHTSQVCRMWRELMLHSPSIWGNIIDLQDLKSKKWRDEVIKRAGTAPLSIHGLITNPTMARVITGWLKSRWKTGIRILDVWVLDTTLYNDRGWYVILTPSHALERFRMEPCPSHLKQTTLKGKLLFGNDAPCIRELECPGYYPDVKTSGWGRNLTSATLGYPSGISHLLDTLSLMPRLESIVFDGTDRKPTVEEGIMTHVDFGRRTPVSLPLLKNISMDRSFDFGDDILRLLQGISPATDCSLTIPRLHFQPTIIRAQYILDLDYKSTVSNYAKNIFSDRQVRSLSISAWAGTFIIAARNDIQVGTFTETSVQNTPFQLTINDHDMSNYGALFSGTLHPFLLGRENGGISEITTLDFILERDLFPTTKFPAYSFVKNIQSDLENIPKTFHQVTTLRASEATLSFLLDLSETRGIVLFPILNELRLASKTDIHSFMQVLKAFLVGRRDAGGKMMSIIDITEYASCRRNWGFLDEFKGLTVIWTVNGITSKYMCGTGDPKSLFL